MSVGRRALRPTRQGPRQGPQIEHTGGRDPGTAFTRPWRAGRPAGRKMSEASVFFAGTGVMLSLFLSAIMTVPLSVLILILYNRAVSSGMRLHGSVDDPVESPLPPLDGAEQPDDVLE